MLLNSDIGFSGTAIFSRGLGPPTLPKKTEGSSDRSKTDYLDRFVEIILDRFFSISVYAYVELSIFRVFPDASPRYF
jgi:hypothetical protein